MSESNFAVEEKVLEPILVAGVRMTGRYQDCGKGFAKLGRHCGRHMNGKPMMLCYDLEYKPEDADIEPCFPVRKGESGNGIEVHTLPGGRCVSLLHKGPYESLSTSYERLFTFAKEKGLTVLSPCREIYHKGLGMIFKGNPKKCLTEILLLIKK